MVGGQLYKGLVEATEKIVAKFGKDVLQEGRFVNILADLYPDRDNPALLGIIKTLVKDGYCPDLLACDKDGVTNYINKSTLALNKVYGYDKVLVENIIYSLAIGSGVISFAEYTSLFSPNPTPSKQTNLDLTKPTSQQKKKPTQKSKYKKPSKQVFTKNEGKKGIALLVLSFFGLFLGTFTYILYLNYSWWMLFTLLLIMLIHLLTILPGISLFDYKNKTYSYIFAGVLLFAFLNYLAPLSFGSDFIKENYTYYFGYMNLDETDGVILCIFAITFLIGIFGAFFVNKSLVEFLDKKEFVITVIVLALIYGSFLYIPEWDKQKTIKQIKAEVSKQELMSETLKKQRSGEEKTLQFKNIELLATQYVFNNTVIGDSNITVKDTYNNKGKYVSSELELSYDGKEYKDVIESVACCDVKWDNKKLKLKAYFVDDLVVALLIKDQDYDNYDYMNISDLIPMYTKKYGDPELKFGSGFDTTHYLINHNYSPSYRNQLLKEKRFFDNLIYQYNWTYKNGGIEIKRKKYSSSNTITYVSSYLIEKLLNHSEKVKEQEVLLKKKEADSLRRVKIEKEKKEREDQIRREKEHKKSIEQI